MLPDRIQQLCTQFMDVICSRTHHILSLEERFVLYHSFGPSRLDSLGYLKRSDLFNLQEYRQLMQTELLNFGIADYALSWLAILTAKHVLPVWDQLYKQLAKDEPIEVTAQEVLQIAEDLLQHKITFDEAMETQDNFYWEGEKIARKVTHNIDCAFRAACATLDFILCGLPRRAYRSVEGEGSDFFVTNALEAYTAIDRNPPGTLRGTVSDFLIENVLKVQKLENLPKEYQFSDRILDIEYDLQKRLEFWEWWLTEAIPQAWELAQQSSSS